MTDKTEHFYDPLRSKFTASTLANFCAAYYAVMTSFRRHWDDIRANEYARLKDLPPAKHGKPSAFRLFILRRYLEKAIELAGFSDILHFKLFDMEDWELFQYVGRPLTAIVLDSWLRPPDHVDMAVYVPARFPIAYLSVGQGHLSSLPALRNSISDSIPRFSELHVSKHTQVQFIARKFVRSEDVLAELRPTIPLARFEKLLLSTEHLELINKSLCCHTNGDITFVLFGLHESTELRQLSELVLYAIEPVRFESFKASREHHRQAVVTCTTALGETSFRADLLKVRTLRKGDAILALTKRIWNSSHRFILEFAKCSSSSFDLAIQKAADNYSELNGQLSFLPVQDLLDCLPKQGEERPIGELEKGAYVLHPDYGPGVVVGKSEINAQTLVEVHFNKKHYREGRIFIPATRKYPAYWKDLMLLEDRTV